MKLKMASNAITVIPALMKTDNCFKSYWKEQKDSAQCEHTHKHTHNINTLNKFQHTKHIYKIFQQNVVCVLIKGIMLSLFFNLSILKYFKIILNNLQLTQRANLHFLNSSMPNILWSTLPKNMFTKCIPLILRMPQCNKYIIMFSTTMLILNICHADVNFILLEFLYT